MNSPATFLEIPSRSACRVASRARRADRVPELVGLKCDANATLDELSVMIVGTGAVGATAARSLAHLQVGELRLVDRGHFKPASLITQPITPSDIGHPKASAIGRLCKDVSPRTRVMAFDGPLQQLALADMIGASVVIVAGDNLSLLHDTGQRCLRLGLKLIHTAVHGETLTAQCRAFGHTTAASPCPVCLFDANEFQMMMEERIVSCEGFRISGGDEFGRSRHHTASLQPLCALAGSMAALQAVKLALELGPPTQDTLLELSAYTWRSLVTPIHRNPNCPCDHERFALRPAPRAFRDCTLADLKRAARLDSTNGTHSLITVEGFRWVERARCGCGGPRPLNRLLRIADSTAGRCPRCRKPIHPQPFYSHDVIPPSVASHRQHQTLRSLGAVDCRGVLVRRDTKAVLLTIPTP
jgi:molybdopterin/thiamine biosynthesis adenylyltransferase